MYYGRFEQGHIFPTKTNIDKFSNCMGMTVEEVQKLIDMEKENYMQHLDEIHKRNNKKLRELTNNFVLLDSKLLTKQLPF